MTGLNRLAAESSPYLRQHADNPVDWYPWGAEAFERARSETRPILLSIGYAACHWCHVMAHESFENEETAALMNSLFVNIKVDREERPDVDSIYMQAVQAMIGQGGWPMTVFLTPDGEPFWGGTYFPPEDRHGIPSFRRVLGTVAAAFHDKRDAVARTTEAMRELYRNASAIGGRTGDLSPTLLDRAAVSLAQKYDSRFGGFQGAPKFPQTMALDFLLRTHARTGDPATLEIVQRSFRAMARGGIYDQIGGGFHRYSVDAEWLVPHFEKMLYDNALLAQLGVHLWQVGRDEEVRRITSDTLAWVEREMTDEEGGFYSSLDADSEGEEGKFYVWKSHQLDVLPADDARLMRAYWNVRPEGNFEGHSILHVPRDPEVVAIEQSIDVTELLATVERSVPILYENRSRRVWPGRDDKVLAGWNGLMLRAFAEAARVFNDARFRQTAIRNGAFLRDRLVRDGRVTRVYMKGEAKVPGFLEDHAAIALAFLSLHSLTLEPTWAEEARRIGEEMERHFRDPATGAWYDTADDAEQLITRPRELFDNATPAGHSLALELMLRLSELDGDSRKRSEAIGQLEILAEPMTRWPSGFGHLLGAVDLALYGAVAVVIVAPNDEQATVEPFMRAVAEHYVPALLIAGLAVAGKPAASDEAVSEETPALFQGRVPIEGKTTAYVCRGFVCDLPATSVAELREQLKTVNRPSFLPRITD